MDVLVVGSCMTDLVSNVSRLPKPGETLHGESFSIGFGGKGANQCIMAAKLGAMSAMVAKVGNDTFGINTVANFTENGVDSKHVGITDAAASGVATISVTETGENAIVIVAGANALLTEQDVLDAERLIKNSTVVVCQLEIQPSVTLAALKLARKHGVRTILNPAPAIAHLSSEFYENSTILCLNESEAEILTGSAVTSLEEATAAIDILVSRGCSTVILTRGESGCLLAMRDYPEPVHVPTRAVQVVDTTGAGDAFIGALAYFISKHGNLELSDICTRANEIATLTVQRRGTQTSFPEQNTLPCELFQ